MDKKFYINGFTEPEMLPVQASDHNWAQSAGRGEGEWVHSGIAEGATVHSAHGENNSLDPHYLKLSWINK